MTAEQLGLLRLDDEEEYLTADHLVESDFVTPFQVLAELPNNDKAVRRFVREGDFGQAEIKCRHVRIDADSYRRKLSFSGTKPLTLIFARIDGRTRVLACKRVSRTSG